MRLGIAHGLRHETPAQWARNLRALGCGATTFPLDAEASDNRIADYLSAAQSEDILIAEVGAWSNPVAENAAERKAAREKCVRQLRLADRIGARCCVNIVGAQAGARWDGAHTLNYSAKAMDDAVACIQFILDEARPKHTHYTIEAMPWMIPDGPEQYLELIRRVDREHFAVHIDIVNWINSPRRYFLHREFIEECFAKLGQYVKSCHLKDTLLAPDMTTSLAEVAVGEGTLDIAAYASAVHAANEDCPLLIEHLSTDEQYIAAMSHARGAIARAGIPMK